MSCRRQKLWPTSPSYNRYVGFDQSPQESRDGLRKPFKTKHPQYQTSHISLNKYPYVISTETKQPHQNLWNYRHRLNRNNLLWISNSPFYEVIIKPSIVHLLTEDGNCNSTDRNQKEEPTQQEIFTDRRNSAPNQTWYHVLFTFSWVLFKAAAQGTFLN